jgi:hypothetical protein
VDVLRIPILITYPVSVAQNRGMVSVLLDVMIDIINMLRCYISSEELSRGWMRFWSNNELRYRKGERDPDCPPNTYRTDIPRKLSKPKTEFKPKK